MGALTLRRNVSAAPAPLDALLEFHSPTAALAVVPVRAGARGTTWVVCTLVAACVAAMALIPIDKVVSAQGRIVSRTPTVVVQPLDTAIVRSINVHDGQTVHRGQILAELDPTFAAADEKALQSQVESLGAEVDRLHAEATGVAYHATASDPDSVLQSAIFMQRQAERTYKMQNYQQKIDGLRAQIQRGMADVTGYQERLRVAQELEAKRIELEKLKVGSQITRLTATDNRLEMARGLASAQAQVQQSVRDLRALTAERDGYDQQWRAQVSQDLATTSRKLSDAREQLRKAQLRRNLVVLRADRDATVLTVAHVSVGSVLQSGDQFITLVPLNAPLEAEIDIPGNDSGFVHQGEPVTVKFDTFPFTQYGYADGTVRVVSADSFTSHPSTTPQRGAASQGDGSMAAFYKGRISLDAIKLHNVPAGFHIVPGMPVTADIKVGKRTLMTYLLGSVMPVAMDGMREP